MPPPREYDQVDTLMLQVQDSQSDESLRAVILAERAQLKMVRLEYREAADDLLQAAEWVATESAELRIEYLFNAATALRYDGDERGQNASLSKALDLYREVLETASRDTDPILLADYRNHYWNTLQTLGEREHGKERIEEALHYNREALGLYDRKREPLQWALTKNNIGNALLVLGEREVGLQRLEEAVNAFDEAIVVYTRTREMLRRAAVYNNKGVALQVLAERESRSASSAEQGSKHLQEATRILRRALKSFHREVVPLDWAMAQVSLGNALVAFGELHNSVPHIKRGLAGYDCAMKEYTQDDMALHWAGVRNNSARATYALGEREHGTGLLRDAERSFREALRVNTRERAPLDWAMMQNNLGNTLHTLSARGFDEKAMLIGAIDAYRDALKEFSPDRTPAQWSAVKSNLDTALRTLTGWAIHPEHERNAGNQRTADQEALPASGLDGDHETEDQTLRSAPSEQSGPRLTVTSSFWVLKGVPGG